MTTTIEDNFRFDTRIRERMIARGKIAPEELQQRLDSLPDLEPETEALDLEQPAATPPKEESNP